MTTQRAALIAAILETPEDDAPRLVCADWFEEQADEASVARGEFIRTQIRRARLPADDPHQSELEARELRLLKRWAGVWSGSHFVFRKARFRRGFIEYVHLHLEHFLHHRRQMLALEPVRDVSLTGWHRAPDNLVRRVAACPEWRHIETVRFHHQGPHKAPPRSVVVLLESPHLVRLKSLRCPTVNFDADARRRFERLEVLRRLTELYLPPLERWPHRAGEWLSDGAEWAGRWGELKSLVLPWDLTLDLLRRLSEAPFWKRLTALAVSLPRQGAEALALLRNRPPASLGRLWLSCGRVAGVESFFERLRHAPLRGLTFSGDALPAASLSRLLDGTNRWDLRELQWQAPISEEQARVLATAAGTRNLVSLSLSGSDLGLQAAQALFSSGRLGSLVHLDLSDTDVGPEGVRALAAAAGWDGLRSLDLANVPLGAEGLRALAGSANLQRLTRLSAGGAYCESDYLGELPGDLAAALTRLPHLADLRLKVHDCDPRSKEILAEGLAGWVAVDCEADQADEQIYRAMRAPERFPPLDPPQDG
jgi:uncharacterized protein (TIGR02996 family)